MLFVANPAGIAAARALLESPPDVADLALELRADTVVYYSVSVHWLCALNCVCVCVKGVHLCRCQTLLTWRA